MVKSILFPLGKESQLKMSINRSIQVKVLDTVLNKETVFWGNKEAAEFLNVGLSTLVRYKKLKKLIKERYLVFNKSTCNSIGRVKYWSYFCCKFESCHGHKK